MSFFNMNYTTEEGSHPGADARDPRSFRTKKPGPDCHYATL